MKKEFVESFRAPEELLGDVLENMFLNPIQYWDRGGRGGEPTTSFPPITSTNVEISPQNFLIFSFNPFVTLV